ncbi:MAG: hypothetical protein K0R46_1046 [Herbinix sp.]|jgi:hypothetical protein|nr:hypothetical protein [Herbinix sp.]
MKTFVKIWLGIALIAIGIGVAVLVIAIASGASFEDVPTFSYEESYSEAKGLDMEIQYGEVKIVQGDTFKIDAVRLPEDGLESYVNEDGTWIIRQDTDRDDNFVDFFGFHLSTRNIFRWNDNFTPRITITLPEDFVADNMSIVIKAGDVEADVIRATTGDFNLAAGRLVVKMLEVSQESSYEIGAGQMTLSNVKVNNITVDCGVGDVRIEGDVTGESDISCDVGKVELDLDRDEDDYSYDISASIGNVSIDNNSYHNISNRVINNDNAENDLSLICEIGKISVDFN